MPPRKAVWLQDMISACCCIRRLSSTLNHALPDFAGCLSVVYSPGRKPPSAATVSKLAQVLPRVPNQPETEEMQDMHPFCQGLRELPVLCTECTDA